MSTVNFVNFGQHRFGQLIDFLDYRMTARLFPMLNGVAIRFDRADAIPTARALAAGALLEKGIAGWFRARRARAVTA